MHFISLPHWCPVYLFCRQVIMVLSPLERSGYAIAQQMSFRLMNDSQLQRRGLSGAVHIPEITHSTSSIHAPRPTWSTIECFKWCTSTSHARICILKLSCSPPNMSLLNKFMRKLIDLWYFGKMHLQTSIQQIFWWNPGHSVHDFRNKDAKCIFQEWIWN